MTTFLHDIFQNPFAKKALAGVVIPDVIVDNLKPGFGGRAYQHEAFKRFIYLWNEDFEGKPPEPLHLVYNMATGSGKTLVMAGLILYLYDKGYRNFIFFVHSNNIITKTKDNFLNPAASKYLFADTISFNGREVYIKETETFDGADDANINIKFTTIQKLHGDLNAAKENSVTYEDFANKKIVLIADEAHHLNATTKNSQISGENVTWEDTVIKILAQSFDNILLEFTATLDYDSQEITAKYRDKVLYRYDLKQFRADKFSKEINLLRSYYDEQERIIQALILNQYRQELAAAHSINLKPVVLFKAKKTIAESERNKTAFHRLIDELSETHIDGIRNNSTVPVITKAFSFFDTRGVSSSEIARRISSNFKPENCISANSDTEAEANQLRLNTLEDGNNPIRAVFAVQKLNEGWDVLNLFDIVRLYEGQNTGGANTTIGKTTLAEAQLIGRGARYFPFRTEPAQDKFTRKYDNDPANDLKILEELYYHTKEDSRYISELKKALIESGIYEDEDKFITKQLTLKLEFKQTDFYERGRVIYNDKIPKIYDGVTSFASLGVSRRNYRHELSSGVGRITSAFSEQADSAVPALKSKDCKLTDISKHIVAYALHQNPYFYYSNLEKYFPNLGSLSRFIESAEYLGGLEITFAGTEARLAAITTSDYVNAMQGLLRAIEAEIKSNLTEYEGSPYTNKYVRDVFTDKTLRIPQDDERANGQEEVVAGEPWYVYNANYGTSEEKAFVSMFKRRFESLSQRFTNIYLIRNERELKIHDEQGRAFEPDFILFCKQREGEELTYQVFIEPKGKHLMGNDKWKEDFLRKIRGEQYAINIDTDKYLVTGVPFYNNANENEFQRTLEGTLE